MKTLTWCWIVGVVPLFVGCQPVTYDVKIINNSPFVTDFRIQSDDDSAPTFVVDLPANGGMATVSHSGIGGPALVDNVTVVSGALIGGDITPIDAQCEANISANDLLTVTKAASGELTCEVTPGTIRRARNAVEQVLGIESSAKRESSPSAPGDGKRRR
jgi:hypothetical protein